MASAADVGRAYAGPPAWGSDRVSAALQEMLERVWPSVVEVRVDGRGAGAGVVWDASGAIVTNFHVVGGSARWVEVALADGRRLAGRVVRRTPLPDLALLRVPAGDLRPAVIGDSTALRAGELVLAVGHPWGQRGAVTVGILSAAGGPAERESRIRPADFIRSDVQLAPGNSGGPLLNAAGQVVGINSMIVGGDLSVAIPSSVVQRWLARSRTPARAQGEEAA